MKRLAMLVLSALLVSSVMFAQQRQRPSADDMAKRQTEQMVSNLSLNDDQKSKVEAINLKYAQQQQAAFQSSNDDRQARMDEMKKMQEAKDTELKGILTSDQYTKYQQNQQERKAKAGNRGGGQGGQKKGGANTQQ